MSWSEERLHRWLARRPRPARLVGSRAHDAAVVERLGARPVLCADSCIEGVHWASDCAPGRVGAKAAARALSDLAATAAEARGLLLALHAPPTRSDAWMRALIEGVAREAERHGAELWGGDLAAAPGPVAAAVSALGTLPGRRRAPGRDRARPGQRVLLSGPVGGSLLGRHLSIEPRLAAGRWLWERGATAMMDVSDGLALDLWRLARSSGVRIELELSERPRHRDALRRARASGRSALDHALHDGEDHELLAALSPAAARSALAEAPGHVPGLVEIGRVREGSGLYLRAQAGVGPWRAWRRAGGYVHGES